MTAVTTGRAGLHARREEPRLPSWEKIGVILAILTQLGGAVWFAASVDQRVAALERELPAGAIASLDQHISDLDQSLRVLEGRR